MRKALAFIILSLSASLMAAQQLPPSQRATITEGLDRAAVVDSIVHEVMQKQKAPGLSVAVARQGKIVFSRGYGLADVENAVATDGATEFRAASLVKPMTAVATMKLVLEKKLNLDAPVQQYCPVYPEKKGPGGKAWTVSVRELLSHRAGLGWYQGNEQRNSHSYASISDSIKTFAERPLEFEPGTGVTYSSYGYVVIGCAMEGASGMPYAQFMQQTIFGPSGMKATLVDDPLRIIPHRSHGYERVAEKANHEEIQNAPFFDPSDRVPAGGFLTTAEDVVRFGSALMAGRLLPAEQLDTIWKPVPEPQQGKSTIGPYGLGWAVYSISGRRVVGHNGGQVGTSTAFRLVPDEQLAVAVMCNLEGVNLDDAVAEILKVYFADSRGKPPVQ